MGMFGRDGLVYSDRSVQPSLHKLNAEKEHSSAPSAHRGTVHAPMNLDQL